MWWKENRDKLTIRDIAKIIISVWEVGRSPVMYWQQNHDFMKKATDGKSH